VIDPASVKKPSVCVLDCERDVRRVVRERDRANDEALHLEGVTRRVAANTVAMANARDVHAVVQVHHRLALTRLRRAERFAHRLELRGVIVVMVRDEDPVDAARIQIAAERLHPRDRVARADARLDEEPRVVRLHEERVSARPGAEDVDAHLLRQHRVVRERERMQRVAVERAAVHRRRLTRIAEEDERVVHAGREVGVLAGR
jgi:hypothetical protein